MDQDWQKCHQDDSDRRHRGQPLPLPEGNNGNDKQNSLQRECKPFMNEGIPHDPLRNLVSALFNLLQLPHQRRQADPDVKNSEDERST